MSLSELRYVEARCEVSILTSTTPRHTQRSHTLLPSRMTRVAGASLQAAFHRERLALPSCARCQRQVSLLSVRERCQAAARSVCVFFVEPHVGTIEEERSEVNLRDVAQLPQHGSRQLGTHSTTTEPGIARTHLGEEMPGEIAEHAVALCELKVQELCRA